MNRSGVMQIAYLTTDEVNEYRAAEFAAGYGATLDPYSPADVSLSGQYDAVIVDWDFLPRPDRQRILRKVIKNRCGGFVAVHSYNLNRKQVLAMRRRRVAVYRFLRPSVFAHITQSMNRRDKRSALLTA
jgi:hypothetical protein